MVRLPGWGRAPEGREATALVRFVPQAWVSDNAIDVDPEGPTEFIVPRTDAAGLRSGTTESDELRDHACAPDWIRRWPGPFSVEIEIDGEVVER